jgi:hypothetical protein
MQCGGRGAEAVSSVGMPVRRLPGLKEPDEPARNVAVRLTKRCGGSEREREAGAGGVKGQ